MDYPSFYIPSLKQGENELSTSESHHAARVMRMQEGDPVFLMNGKGNTAEGIILQLHKKNVIVKTTEIISHTPSKINIHLAIAPTKKWDRMEYLLEKLTELGINEVSPLICKHSERRFWKEKKVEGTVISAMKQSRNPYLLKVNEMVKMETFIAEHKSDQLLLAHCREGVKTPIISTLQPGNVIILIGPEGDFSKEEIELALRIGAKSVTLGSLRLRTETAGLYAAITAKNYNETV